MDNFEKYFLDNKINNIYKPIELIVAGIFTGILSGFFGGGGGMIAVPMLSFILNISEKQAHATAMGVILPVTIVSAVVYHLQGVQYESGFSLIILGVIIGGLLGAYLLKILPTKIIGIIFYGVMIGAGIKMII